MRILKTIVLILLCKLCIGQNSDTIMYLHNWVKPKKVDKITNDLYITVEMQERNAVGELIPTSYSGLLLYVRHDEIVMTIREENFIEFKENGTKIKSSRRYAFVDSLKKINDGELRTIKIDDMYSVSHFTEKRISNVGGGIAAFSAFAALVIAPLVSINYRTGDFNQKIYYPVLAGCGIGFAVGIPLNVIFRKNKYYKIKNFIPETADSDYWSIQTK